MHSTFKPLPNIKAKTFLFNNCHCKNNMLSLSANLVIIFFQKRTLAWNYTSTIDRATMKNGIRCTNILG